MGNDGNEYKIITQVFLYKFLNDKFGYEVKKVSPVLKNAEKWELVYAEMSEDDRLDIFDSLPSDIPLLNPEHLIANLWNQQAKGDFDLIFDSTMTDIADKNIDIFSTQTAQNTKIPLFEKLTQYVTDDTARAPFARALVDKLVNFSFEEAFEKAARDWYEKEAAKQTWSVRTLQRNISSQYYYRMLKTQKKELVESEMKELTAPYQNDKLEFIKNPVVAEFLGFSQNTDFTESDLEKSILSNLQKFLMELGKGYAFVARQQHIHTEKQDYYIDLVFYNYILKCFVLIDLKTEKITHQDVGQMDMYIRMYDELKRSEGDNPTIGIVLCSDTDDDIARYSVMHGNEQLFASKYKLYLPTKEELKAEIETQKAMFYLQQQDNEDRNKNYTFNIE